MIYLIMFVMLIQLKWIFSFIHKFHKKYLYFQKPYMQFNKINVESDQKLSWVSFDKKKTFPFPFPAYAWMVLWRWLSVARKWISRFYFVDLSFWNVANGTGAEINEDRFVSVVGVICIGVPWNIWYHWNWRQYLCDHHQKLIQYSLDLWHDKLSFSLYAIIYTKFQCDPKWRIWQYQQHSNNNNGKTISDYYFFSFRCVEIIMWKGFYLQIEIEPCYNVLNALFTFHLYHLNPNN